jgi:hypothetical protein
MKNIKVLLFCLLLLLAAWAWGAEIHDAAPSGDHFIVTPTAVSGALGCEAACAESEKRDGCR